LVVFQAFSAINRAIGRRVARIFWVTIPAKAQAAGFARHARDQGDQLPGQIGDMWRQRNDGWPLGAGWTAAKSGRAGVSTGSRKGPAGAGRRPLRENNVGRDTKIESLFSGWVLNTIIRNLTGRRRAPEAAERLGAVATRDPQFGGSETATVRSRFALQNGCARRREWGR